MPSCSEASLFTSEIFCSASKSPIRHVLFIKLPSALRSVSTLEAPNPKRECFSPNTYSSVPILNDVNEVSKYSPLCVRYALLSLFLSISPSRVEITYPPFFVLTTTFMYWFEISSVLLSSSAKATPYEKEASITDKDKIIDTKRLNILLYLRFSIYIHIDNIHFSAFFLSQNCIISFFLCVKALIRLKTLCIL